MGLPGRIRERTVDGTPGTFVEGEMMRSSKGLRRVAAVVLLSLIVASAAMSADEPDDRSDRFGLRVSGGAIGFPLTTANAKLEAAVALSDVSLSAWLDLPYLPLFSAVAGGEVTLSIEWLSVSAKFSSELTLCQHTISFEGRAAPSAWLLFSGSTDLLGGVTASALVTDGPQWGSDGNRLTLSPYVTAVIPAGEVLLSSTVGFDAQTEAGDAPPGVSGSRVVSTVDAWSVIVTNTVEFSGAFDALAAVSVSLSLPHAGLTLTGSFLPSATGGEASYRLSGTYVFGNQSLLPYVSGNTGLVCSGGTCYVP